MGVFWGGGGKTTRKDAAGIGLGGGDGGKPGAGGGERIRR